MKTKELFDNKNLERSITLLAILMVSGAALGSIHFNQEDENREETLSDEKNPIIIMAVDPMRDDRLSIEGYRRNVTPNLDRFISHSTYFKNAYTTSSWTLPSASSVLTGKYPSETGVMTTSYTLCKDEETFSELAQRNGYYTAAYVGGNHVSSTYGLSQGFDLFTEGYSYSRNSIEKSILIHRVVEKPFLLYIQGFDTHLGYMVPEKRELRWGKDYSGDMYEKNAEFLKDLQKAETTNNSLELYFKSIDVEDGSDPRFNADKISKEDFRHLRDMYDNSLFYVDRNIGEIMYMLKQEGLYNQSTIILYSHHGQELGEQGNFGHRRFYQEVVEVPLAVKLPHQTEQRIVEKRVEIRDIYPTVLRQAGADYNGDATPLQDIEKQNTETVFSEDLDKRMVINGSYKLIEKVNGETESFRLYNLENDENETENLFSKKPDRTASMSRMLELKLERNETSYCRRN